MIRVPPPRSVVSLHHKERNAPRLAGQYSVVSAGSHGALEMEESLPRTRKLQDLFNTSEAHKINPPLK
jgi:hypothetical protein